MGNRDASFPCGSTGLPPAETVRVENAHCRLAPVGPSRPYAISNSPDSVRRRLGGQLPDAAWLPFPRRHAGRSRREHQDRHPGVAASGGGGIRGVQSGGRPRHRLSHAQVAWHQPRHRGAGFHQAWFRIAREGKHTVMSNGRVRLTILRHDPINAFTMAEIARDAGLTPEQF